jgi:hypothetical protein
MPDGVTNIGGNAFYGCKSLTSIRIPKNVTTIDGSAFSNTGITTVYWDSDQYTGPTKYFTTYMPFNGIEPKITSVIFR